MLRLTNHCFIVVVLSVCVRPSWVAAEDTAAAKDAVSYYTQIRPIFQAHCQGCHQPAKQGGEYVMTSFEALLKGGESEDVAVVPGKPTSSNLIDQITPKGDKAEMPKGKKPLAESELALIRKWIEQGASDDTPASARQLYDKDNPPVYTRPPVITSIDYSPDGKTLAVAGFHEVLLFNVETAERVARLVGMSERIESVSFSPDGKRLCVAGGSPGRIGEIQIWDVEKKELKLSVPTTYDTVYGGSWSPDGKLIAYGCADTAVRAIESETGKEVLYMAAHDDWARDTVFSADGKSVFSVSRDQTVKQTDVMTERFVGNVTTHTPGILKGGMIAIARHPKKNELLAGGADGAPKLFRMDVKAAPAGGGNPNQIREYSRMTGRVFDVEFNADGMRAFASSSLDGAGQIRAFETDNGKQVWNLDVAESGIYALAVSPDGKTLAATGSDGSIRLIDAAKGEVVKQFASVEVSEVVAKDAVSLASATFGQKETVKSEALPNGAAVADLTATPANIEISDPTQYIQLALTAALATGDQLDVTRIAKWTVEGKVGQVSARGLFTPSVDGTGKLIAEISGKRVEISVSIDGLNKDFTPDFIRDVGPVISRLGCNAGTCHGSKDGKNGFKLSLRGYDAIADVRAFTDDLASRRANVASPEKSLMLLKASGSVPHQGGQVATTDSKYYRIIHDWIGAGAKLNTEGVRVASIEVFPKNPTIQQLGAKQQVRVVATYTDGATRDVTREAVISSGEAEIATIDGAALLTSLRRGEAPVLARYEGAYAATTVTVMGDRTGFAWKEPESWGRIDELAAAKWKRMKIEPSGLCTDADFFRRVYLDLTGMPPKIDEVKAFLADNRETKIKRDELIDKLIGSDDYIEYWTNKWADLLQVNRKFLGPQGAVAFRAWIRGEMAANTPYDDFCRKILTASGSNKDNPQASYFKILRTPADTMENTTHLFLGVRFNCNKCHDHPFERWTQDQYYETAAYLAQFELKTDPASGKSKIGGTAVEGAKPLYEIIADKNAGDIKHDRTQQITPPQFPFECKYEAPENATRRQQLAAWITSPDNQYFARSYVNRLWGYLFGIGIIEPIDDIRAGNPATNPELLDYLTEEFIKSGFNVRQAHALICKSRTYQLSIVSNKWNDDDRVNYSHAVARRLPAEVLYDAVHRVTGSVTKIPGVPAGTRAAAIPDSGVKLSDGFLGNLGRPPRESACECERTSGLELGPVMALISGPTVGNAISDAGNELAKLVASEKDDKKLIDNIFLRVLNRPATESEIAEGLKLLQEMPMFHEQLVAELKKFEESLAKRNADQANKRQAMIDNAKKALAEYEKQLSAEQKKLSDDRNAKIAAAEMAVKKHEEGLPAKLAAWEAKIAETTAWAVLESTELTATNNAKFEKQSDGSYFVTGPEGKGSYKFVAKTDLEGITGIKLEAFADDRLPAKGPGRAQNGNFVLTEFRVERAAASEPDKKQPVALHNAQADFSQNGYAVATAIDGNKAGNGNGWATSPMFGSTRTAVFETKANAGGGIFTFWLDQEFNDGKHAIGRFRISVTKSPRPVRLDGLPKNITDILAVATDQRTDKQKGDLLNYYRGIDGELKKLQAAIAEAKKPLAKDPKLAELQNRITAAELPLQVDPRLGQLRADVEISKTQLGNTRLIAAQDLTWALINNPAFLFNH
jgi:WD40 repeat protein